MTDGNTGIQVAPVSKEEAMNLQSMFSKVAQALVNASNLPEQVAALSKQVDDLTAALSNKTIHAEELDKTVHELRQQRDDARSESNSLHNEIDSVRRDLDRANRTIDSQDQSIADLQGELSKARHDRDDYGLQVLALEDQVKTWKEKADKARVRLNDVLSVFKQEDEAKPEPENIPAFIEPKQEAPNPTAPTSQPQDSPQPEQSASPTETSYPLTDTTVSYASSESEPQAQPEQTSPRYTDRWEPGAIWDQSAQKYRLDH